jgi:hypothetical protein
MAEQPPTGSSFQMLFPKAQNTLKHCHCIELSSVIQLSPVLTCQGRYQIRDFLDFSLISVAVFPVMNLLIMENHSTTGPNTPLPVFSAAMKSFTVCWFFKPLFTTSDPVQPSGKMPKDLPPRPRKPHL